MYEALKPCDSCGKERLVPVKDWEQGKRRLCHKCYMRLVHNPRINKEHFLSGNPNWHGGAKKQSNGYILIKLHKNHPYFCMASKRDHYVLLHRLVMAETLNRPLLENEIVHHIDGNTTNNDISNLMVSNKEEHELGYKAGYAQGFHDGTNAILAEIGIQFIVCPNTDTLRVEG